MNIREYRGPLTVLAAGALGFSLICIVSAAALGNPATSSASDLEPQDIVDSAFSNPINTVVALTVVEMAEFLPTPTPADTLTASATISSSTPTRVFLTWTPHPPTRTRDAQPTATLIPSRTPSRTPIPPTDTNTPIPPTHTVTPEPTDTDTPEPPTDTNTPPPDTVTPGPTNTLESTANPNSDITATP